MLWERASEHGPLVVIMEDIHWADESTRHLLRFLARALTDAPVMIIASYRTDELTRRHPLRPFLAEIGRLTGTVRVDVPSLDRAEVAELLSRLLDRPPSNAVIDMVFRRSEGIPYFVEELTRSAARGCIDMPDTLRDALNVRVQTLSDEAQQVVELAAVAGNRVEHELLARRRGGATLDLDSRAAGGDRRCRADRRRDRVRLPARAAARGGARRPAARPARPAARPLRRAAGGAPRAGRPRHRAAGDRPPLVGGARGEQGVPSGRSPRPGPARRRTTRRSRCTSGRWSCGTRSTTRWPSPGRGPRCSSRRRSRRAMPARTSGRWPWSPPPWPRPDRTPTPRSGSRP